MVRLFFILTPILISVFISCQNQINNSLNPFFNDISGSWKIIEVYLTNGPICYDIKVGDTIQINFEESKIKLIYTVFSKIQNNVFNIDSIDNEVILGSGYFSNTEYDSTNLIQQKIYIKINQHFLIIKISQQTNVTNVDTLNWGDVAHFKVVKIK